MRDESTTESREQRAESSRCRSRKATGGEERKNNVGDTNRSETGQ